MKKYLLICMVTMWGTNGFAAGCHDGRLKCYNGEIAKFARAVPSGFWSGLKSTVTFGNNCVALSDPLRKAEEYCNNGRGGIQLMGFDDGDNKWEDYNRDTVVNRTMN